MKVSFFTDSLQAIPNSLPSGLIIFFVIFWIFISLLGLLLRKHEDIRYFGLFFSLISFLPFSFLCYQSNQEKSDFTYRFELETKNQLVRVGDSVEILDLEIPLQEFYAYQIVSTSTSKKSGRSYSDQIFIKHNSGLRFPLGIEETVYESKDKGNFSRFAKLSRYIRKYQKIHQLPVLDMLDEPMKGLLVPSPLLSSTPERKHSIPNPQYPIHWKYKVTMYPFYFLFFFFVPGHLGLAFLILKFKRKETVLSPILFLLLGYLVSGCIYYKWVWEKKDLGYKLDKSESTFYLYETRKNSPDIQIAKLDTKNDFVYELEIPMKRVTVFTSSYYKSLKRLYRSLQSDTIESEDPLNVIPSLFQVDEIQTWDFSDLAMETVLRILVDWKEEERLSW